MLIKDRVQRIVWGIILFIIVAVLDYLFPLAPYRIYLYSVPYLVSGHMVLYKAVKNTISGQIFDEFSLMSLATIGAFVIGEYPEGVFVMLFYELGEFAQHKAVIRVKKQIRSLVDKRPEEATILKDGEQKSVKAKSVKIGSTLLIKKGERVPIDGKLLSMEATFNTADITGESLPRQVKKGESVSSGFINNGPPIQIESTKKYEDSTFSRIIKLTQQAAERKAPTERFFRKFAKVYTPIVAILAIGIFLLPAFFMDPYIWQEWLYRACVFLVISCPCALVLSIPLTYFAGIGAASKSGILIKGSNYIDQLTRLSGMVFDKTGTLTKGQLKVNKLIPAAGNKEYLEAIKELTGHSNHPASEAISNHLAGSNTNGVTQIKEHTGKGLSGQYKGATLKVGSPKWVAPDYQTHSNTDTVVLASQNDHVVYEFQLSDQLKDDAEEVIQYMGRNKICTYLLSGDIDNIVQHIAKELKFHKAKGNVDPESKLKYYNKWKKEEKGSLAFVGDGINDSIALVASDLGIAIGNTGSDVAIESADVVIPGERLEHIPQTLLIAKQTKKILWQNIILVFAVKILVLALGGVGIISLWMAIIADVGIALVAVLNASRLIFYSPKWK
jgi:Cd2+/Zn2+-exporting ATPase